jgi:hypothetical protein
MKTRILKKSLMLLMVGLSITVAEAAPSHDKLAADCKDMINKDVRSNDTAAFCLNAESAIAKESPNSAAHTAILVHLALASGYNEKIGKSSMRSYYEKSLVVAEAGFGKASLETIEPRMNLAAMDSEGNNWGAARGHISAALEASMKHQNAESERQAEILSALAKTYRQESTASPSTYKVADAAVVQKKLAENTEARLGLKKYETGIEWLEFGKLLLDSGNKAEAKRATEKALQILIDGKGGN